MKLIPHRRQFLITNDKNLQVSGFLKKDLPGNNLFFFYDKELEITEKENNIYLLGKTVTPDIDIFKDYMPSIDNEYIRLTYASVGRWALLTDRFIFSDPASLMGLYYSINKEQNTFALSSSIGLLKDIFLNNKITEDPRSIQWGAGGNGYICWYCPPYTKYAEIKKLLPSQQFNFAGQSVTFLKRLYFKDFISIPYEKKIALTAGIYKNILAALGKKFNRLFIALTSGNDSRQTLAAALAAGVNVEAFTFTHPHISKHDLTIPGSLALKGNIPHRIIKENGLNEADREIFHLHSANNTHDGDQYFVYHNQYQALDLDDNDAILRTGISPLVKKLYWEKFSAYPHWNNIDGTIITSVFKTTKETEWTVTALNEWIEWYKKNNAEVDWRDRFLLDQREGGWMSLNEHSLDILPYHSVQPFNCQLLIDLYLSFDNYRGIKNKKTGAYKIAGDIINYLKPELNRVKYNPLDYKRFLTNKFKLGLRKIKRRAFFYNNRKE